MFVFVCEWCNQIKEVDVPEHDREYERDKRELSEIDFLVKYSQPTSHYICSECIRKVLMGEGKDA